MKIVENQAQLFINHNLQPGLTEFSENFSPDDLTAAQNEISLWPAYQFTPLIRLQGLAQAYSLSALLYKDESARFGLKSIKAIGGAYAVCRLLQKRVADATGKQISSEDLRQGTYRDITQKITVTAATEGNHGRSVAWGAAMFHCRCVIYVPKTCMPEREQAIASYGAVTIETRLGYDDTVRQCAQEARRNGWMIVSDTSWEGYSEIPSLIMQGYTVTTAETVRQLAPAEPPTHVFVQAGVGGVAAAIVAGLRQSWRHSHVRFIVVEPESAACLYASAISGQLTPTKDVPHTIMTGLVSSEASPLAWGVLKESVYGFLTIPDSLTQDCMKLLANPPYGDVPIIAGESGVAGLAALRFALQNGELRAQLGLNHSSRVLLFGTEGDTAPEYYCQLTGESADAVRARINQYHQR